MRLVRNGIPCTPPVVDGVLMEPHPVHPFYFVGEFGDLSQEALDRYRSMEFKLEEEAFLDFPPVPPAAPGSGPGADDPAGQGSEPSGTTPAAEGADAPPPTLADRISALDEPTLRGLAKALSLGLNGRLGIEKVLAAVLAAVDPSTEEGLAACALAASFLEAPVVAGEGSEPTEPQV